MTEKMKTAGNIDPDNLDMDCMEQPQMVRYWNRALATAKKNAAAAKDNLKLAFAQMRTRIRESPGSFRLEKVTVDTVDDAAIQTPEYIDAAKRLVDADYNEALIKAEVEALKSQDYQLTNLGELLKLSYWNAPRIDPATRDRYLRAKQHQLNDEAARLAQDSKPKSKGKK
jgi:hypothetical protein